MTAVIDARDVDHAANWIERAVECECAAGLATREACSLHVGLALLREARRFEAHEVPW